MTNLESEVNTIEIIVRAGPNGESSDVYAWINSPLPPWVKSVDDESYLSYTRNALATAKDIVRRTKRNIVLTMNVSYVTYSSQE